MKRILVVDDDGTTRLILKNFLSSANYEVDLAENGTVAIELLKNKTYDLIITDMIMPEKDGIEIFQYIIFNKIQIKTIVISAGGVKHGSENYLKLAKDFYPLIDGTLSKPIIKEDLTEMVNKLLSNYSAKI